MELGSRLTIENGMLSPNECIPHGFIPSPPSNTQPGPSLNTTLLSVPLSSKSGRAALPRRLKSSVWIRQPPPGPPSVSQRITSTRVPWMLVMKDPESFGCSITTAPFPHSSQDIWVSACVKRACSIKDWVRRTRKACESRKVGDMLMIRMAWDGSTVRCPSLFIVPSDLSWSRRMWAVCSRYLCGSLNRRKFPGWSCGTSVLNTTSSGASGKSMWHHDSEFVEEGNLGVPLNQSAFVHAQVVKHLGR